MSANCDTSPTYVCQLRRFRARSGSKSSRPADITPRAVAVGRHNVPGCCGKQTYWVLPADDPRPQLLSASCEAERPLAPRVPIRPLFLSRVLIWPLSFSRVPIRPLFAQKRGFCGHIRTLAENCGHIRILRKNSGHIRTLGEQPPAYVCQVRHAIGLCLPTATISGSFGAKIVAFGRHNAPGCRVRQT